MSTQLIQILAFADVANGATEVLAHNINVNGRKLIPDLIGFDVAGFSVVAIDDDSIEIQNDSWAEASVNVWLEFKQTTQRWFGAQQTENLTPHPFVFSPGGASGGGGGGVELEDSGGPVAGGPFTTLNFNNVNVRATDAGGGVADVTALPNVLNDPDGQGPGIPLVTIDAFTVHTDGLSLSMAGKPGSTGFRLMDTVGTVLEYTSYVGAREGYINIENLQVLGAPALGSALVGGAAATGTQNDVSVATGAVQVNPGAGGLTITGFAIPASVPWQTDAMVIVVWNNGVDTLTLPHEDAGSTDNNRFALPGGASLVIPANGGAIFRRGTKPTGTVGGTVRWFCVGKNI